MDLIDRQAALDAIYKTFAKSLARTRAEEVINSVPSAERHGEWIQKSTGGESFYTCSRCGFIAWEHEDTNYCPNCGATMRGE